RSAPARVLTKKWGFLCEAARLMGTEMVYSYRLLGFFLCGLLLVCVGAMPLNGYIGYLIAPSEFHHDAFVGSFGHLSLGLAPLLLGIAIMILGSDRARHLFSIVLAGIVL